MRFSHFLSLIFPSLKRGAVAAWPVWPVFSVVMETAGALVPCKFMVARAVKSPVPFSFVLLSISSIAFP